MYSACDNTQVALSVIGENVSHSGQLVRWNEDRGFGFIKTQSLDKDVFVHISALKDIGKKPKNGDVLHFSVAQDDEGKLKAYNVTLDGQSTNSVQKPKKPQTRPTQQSIPANNTQHTKPKKGRSYNLFVAIGLFAVAGAILVKRTPQSLPQTSVESPVKQVETVSAPAAKPVKSADKPPQQTVRYVAAPRPKTYVAAPRPKTKEDFSGYRCEGKQHCSQMKSCKEARFYLKNCPNVKIDGDKDGIPCEQQLCPF